MLQTNMYLHAPNVIFENSDIECYFFLLAIYFRMRANSIPIQFLRNILSAIVYIMFSKNLFIYLIPNPDT